MNEDCNRLESSDDVAALIPFTRPLVARLEGTVTSAIAHGSLVRFFVTDGHDLIQCFHSRGEFYEGDELAIIASHFPQNGVFVDIGANVGNHTIFAGKFLNPRQIIVVEPNPLAIEILKINILLNDLATLVDVTHLGVGISDSEATAISSTPAFNLGATKLHIYNGVEGTLRVVRGDSLLRDRRVDFLKIDIEGMEMNALAGLKDTIARWRPAMFVEVDNSNVSSFHRWLQDNSYIVIRTYRRYSSNENYLVVPQDLPGTARSA